MSTVITTLGTDVFLRTIVNITTSIVSTNALYNWFIEHKNNDYQIYQNKITSTDLNNRLSVASALIKDIIKKYYLEHDPTTNDVDSIINEFIKNNQGLEEVELIKNDDFSLINYTENYNTTIKIPEALRISLLSTMEIINIINKELCNLQHRITSHKKNYSSMLYSINIEKEINIIYSNSLIFEKRMELFFKIIDTYKALVIYKMN